MPQKCQVCVHPSTEEIDSRIVKGESNYSIAKDYDGLDYQNIWRHAQNHLPAKLTRAVKAQEQQHAENMLDGIKDLLDRTKRILDDAEDKNQKSLALKAIKEARGTYELLSKIAVKLEQFKREDDAKEQHRLDSQASDGFKALSDTELKAFIQLTSKIHANDPNYELDPRSRYLVESMSRMSTQQHAKDDDTRNNSDATHQSDKPDVDRRENSSKQAKDTKTTQSTDDDLTLDDLDDFDLSFDDDDDTIPSSETDPAWLVRYRDR